MKGKLKTIVVMAVATGLLNISFAQAVIPLEITNNPAPNRDSAGGLLNYAKHKKIPLAYEQEALSALSHFPELKNVPIKFRVKKSVATLKTRPTFWSMFMPRGHRGYVIVISNKTISKLTPLTVENLPEDARVGVIGHELSHVVDFSKKTMWQSFKTAIGHLSKRYMDSLEYHTDQICIEHGLGKELETWSSYIRNTMHTQYWRGADFVKRGDTHYERYMNPSTIEKYIVEQNSQLRRP